MQKANLHFSCIESCIRSISVQRNPLSVLMEQMPCMVKQYMRKNAQRATILTGKDLYGFRHYGVSNPTMMRRQCTSSRYSPILFLQACRWGIPPWHRKKRSMCLHMWLASPCRNIPGSRSDHSPNQVRDGNLIARFLDGYEFMLAKIAGSYKEI